MSSIAETLFIFEHATYIHIPMILNEKYYCSADRVEKEKLEPKTAFVDQTGFY